MNWKNSKKNRWGFRGLTAVLITVLVFTLPISAFGSSEQTEDLVDQGQSMVSSPSATDNPDSITSEAIDLSDQENAITPEAIDLSDQENAITPEAINLTPEAIDTSSAYLQGQIIVKYRDGISKRSKSGINSKIAGIAAQVSSYEDTSLLQVDDEANITKVLEDLKNDSDILYAEPNYIASALTAEPFIPNDPSFSEQWALEMIDAPEAWQIPELNSSSSQVTVAVLDTGINTDHPDLDNRILTGRNFADYMRHGTPYTDQMDYNDDEGHGTQVSGIIAAECNNGVGISGVAGPGNLKILPVKVLNDYGEGTVFDIAEGIRWAADQPGVSIINLSLGLEYYSYTLAASVEYAQNKGILVIAAAGNENRPVSTMFPAAFPGVLAVGSVDSDSERVSYSNYGQGLDLMAPGYDILTTSWYEYNDEEEYSYVFGTSMAAPHVSAVAGMYKLIYPDATAGEIASVLKNTTTDLEGAGWDSMTGYGLLNAAAALTGNMTDPGTIEFISPESSAKVTGKVTVAVEAIEAENINKVVFYLDEAVEDNKLAEVPGTGNGTTASQYSFQWDTTLTDIADGSHTLIAQAYLEANPVGEPVSISITVKNDVTSGMLLQILDPNGGPASDAEVTIYEKINDYYDEESYYSEVYSETVDGTGMLRIPAVLLADLRKYELVVQGTFDPLNSEEWVPYVYHRTYESPQSDVIDGSSTTPVSLSMLDLQNEPLEFAKYILTIKDSQGNDITVMDQFHSYLDDPCVVYVEEDNCDAYAYWSPSSAEGLAYDYDLDKEYSENLYTYFLSKKDVTIQDNMNLVFNTENAGTIVPVLQEHQNRVNITLQNEMINDVMASYIGTLSSTTGIVTIEGEYDLWATLNQGTSDSSWSYYFHKPEMISITKGTITDYKCGGGLAVTLTTETPQVKAGASFYPTARFSDPFGNNLTSVYYYDSYYYSGNTGFKYPIFQINTRAGAYVISSMGSSNYLSPYWYLAQPVGEYTATLQLIGSNIGPINNYQTLEATLDFEVVANDIVPGETIPVQVTGRTGQPVSHGVMWLFNWETFEEEGEEYGYWNYLMGIGPDAQSNFNVPADLQIHTDKTYVAVVVDYEDGNANTIGWKKIASLGDLNGISLGNARPVDFTVTNKSGTNKEGQNVGFSLALNADSNDDTLEYLGTFSGWNDLYLIPGDYQFSTSFNEGNAATYDQYLLRSDKTSITEDPENNPVTVALRGQDAGQIALETTPGFNIGTINAYTEEGYGFYTEMENPDTDINLYMTEGMYSGFAEIWQTDPETEPSGPIMTSYEDNYKFYVWKHYLEFGNSGKFSVDKNVDTTWRFGGPFEVDLDLEQTALTLEDTLYGSSIVMDGFHNRQFDMETDEWWMGGEPQSADSDGQFTYRENMSNRFYRTSEGGFAAIKDAAVKTWEDGVPFLRIYRQNDTGEERVLNQSSDDYYYYFNETLGDWGTEGRYRAELAIGIGPDGPIATGTDEKYYFTIGNPQDSPVITAPINGKYFNSRTFTVQGTTIPNQSVEVYAYLDTMGTTPDAVIQADESGQFSGSVTVSQDGQFKILAKLPNGNPSEILNVNIDTVAPGKPAVSAALAADGKSVNLNITGASGENSVTVLIYRNSILIAEKQSGTLYTDISAGRGMTYIYQVAWEDQAGNRSALSDPVTITIPAGLQSAYATYDTSPSGYAKLDHNVTVTGRGNPGMTGSAILTILPSTGSENLNRPMDLTETEPGFYQGMFTLDEGMASIAKIDVYLEDSAGQGSPVDALKGKPILVGGTLSGTVNRTNVGAVSGININIYPDDGYFNGYLTISTDSTGAYRVDGLSPGTYTVSCYDTLSKQYYELDELEVAAGIHLINNPIMLPEYRNLTISAVDKDDPSINIAGITVSLYNDREYRTGMTGSDGKLLFENLPAGTYQWAVSGASNLQEPYQNASGTLTIPSASDTYTIFLTSLNNMTGSISGKVTDSNGNPISGVTVDVWSWENYNAGLFGGRGYNGKAVSDVNGNYTISKLLPGTDYRITFNHPDYLQKTVTGGTVILGQNSDIGTQTLTLAGKAKGIVRGTDFQNNTLPLADIPIQLNNYYSYARTLGDGSYAFNSLSPGNMTITANGYQIGYSASSAAITVGEGQTVTQNFDLKELGVIDGRVTDSQGNPIQYVYLSASGPTNQFTRTDSLGRFYLRSLKAGDYTVNINSAPVQYVRQTKSATVLDLQRTELNFTLNTTDELARAFGGAGNSMSVNTVQTAPGETLRYAASYTNNSLSPVENVQITLEIPDNTTLVTGINGPALNGISFDATVENQKFTVNIGTVAAGERGQIIYHVMVDGNINEETEISVTGNISWNIGTESRNSALGTAQTSVLFSSIYAPGITSDGKIKVYGKTVPGSLVQVYDGETLLGTTTVNGRWWYMDVQLSAPAGGLEEETHDLVAVAVKDDNTSNASRRAQVVYRADVPMIEDTLITAGWNKNVSNNPHIGIVTMGVTELTPFSVKVKFDDNQAVQDVKFRWLDKDYTMTLKDSGYYEGNVPYGWQVYGEQMVYLHFKDTAQREYEFPLALFIILIDPSGFVYEGVPSNRLEGVTATVQQKVGGIWQNWNAELFGQNNPQVTDDNGNYGWDVPAGTWRVIFSKAGYETFNTEAEAVWDGIVPPPKFDLNVNMRSDAIPAIVAKTPASSAVDVPVGSTINIEFSKYMKLSSFTGNLTLKKESTNEIIAGTIAGTAIENGLTKTVKFTPNQNLENNTVYRVNLTTARDYTDKTVAADTWTFTTVAAQDQPSHNNNGGGGGGSSALPTGWTEQKISALKGGSLSAEGATVTIPPEVLPADTTLSMRKLTDKEKNEIVSGSFTVKLGSAVYEIKTAGTTNFGNKMITIKIPYTAGKIAEGEFATIHYYNETTKQWIGIPTRMLQENGIWYAVTDVNHLTKFAVFSTETQVAAKVIRFIIGESNGTVNGETITMDVKPYVDPATWRTMAPIRFVSEALGADVQWIPDKKMVIVKLNDKIIELTINSPAATIGGKAVSMDCSPQIVEPGRVMVPIRFISEAFDAIVDYNSDTKEIMIQM